MVQLQGKTLVPFIGPITLVFITTLILQFMIGGASQHVAPENSRNDIRHNKVTLTFLLHNLFLVFVIRLLPASLLRLQIFS